MPTFDRIPSPPDPRDEPYTAHRLTATIPDIRTRLHTGPYVRIDQGNEGACVGFGITNDLLGTPNRIRPPGYKGDLRGGKLWAANDLGRRLYHTARSDFDEWPGEDYDGTSCRAGFLAARSFGYIDGFLWIRTPTEFRLALQAAPVVIGVNWYTDMGRPDRNGNVTVGGALLGGHCICVNGTQVRAGGRLRYRARQSWGEHHGDRGDIWFDGDELEDVIFNDQGEAAVFVGEKYLP